MSCKHTATSRKHARFVYKDDIVITWWARQIRSRSCLCRNLATTSEPKVKDTPLSFSPQPKTSLSGSDQSKSHSRPWSGTSVGRMMRLICSMDWRSGDSPKQNGSKCTNKHTDTEVETHCTRARFTSVDKLQRALLKDKWEWLTSKADYFGRSTLNHHRKIKGKPSIFRLIVVFLQIQKQKQKPTSMAAKDLLIYDGSNREAVKTICEGLPEFDVVPSFT